MVEFNCYLIALQRSADRCMAVHIVRGIDPALCFALQISFCVPVTGIIPNRRIMLTAAHHQAAS